MSTNKSFAKQRKVQVIGEGYDEIGRRYLVLDVGVGIDIPPIPCETIQNSPNVLYGILANAGWNGFQASSKNALLERLERSQSDKARFQIATRLGWRAGAFVLGENVVGASKKQLRLSLGGLDHAMVTKFRSRGSVQEWKRLVAKLSEGNSRLMFAIALAFTGPTMWVGGGPSGGGFQIYGAAESGKTTAAIVAGSVWGCHRAHGRRERGFAETWNSTAGKLEVTALAHNDVLLILDETKRAGVSDKERYSNVAAVSFGLAEGIEKERLTNANSARSWRCFFLSTSNHSLDELAAAAGAKVDDALRGRLVDIPLPGNGHGILENLHQFKSGERMVEHLQRSSRQCFGSAGIKYVECLARERKTGKRALKAKLKKDRRTYRRALAERVALEDLKPLTRNSARFAAVFAAGCKAIAYGILPWERNNLLKAVLGCQLDQLRTLKMAAPTTPATVEVLRQKLVEYLADCRPVDLGVDKPTRASRKDLPVLAETKGGEAWLYLTAKKFAEIVGKKPAALQLKRQLAEEGFLAKDNGKFVVQRSVYADGRGQQKFERVHAIKANFLHGK